MAAGTQRLRFTVPSKREEVPPAPLAAGIVNADTLGGYEVLAEQLSPAKIAEVPEVQGLEELLRTGSPDLLDTLIAVVSTNSLRQAAKLAHLHHKSVAARVEQVERALNFDVMEPYGRARLLLLMTLHRIKESHSLF